MGLLINNAMFVGKYSISANTYTSAKVDKYIAKYEEWYLKQLLGVELFKLFKADVAAGAPVTAKYVAIFNAIDLDDSQSDCIRSSSGMVEMLLGFIYFEYMKVEGKFQQTPSGVSVAQSENSRETSLEEASTYDRYNESIEYYTTIQWYIYTYNKLVDYPLFNGQIKELSTWI